MSITTDMYDFDGRPFAIDLLCGIAEIHIEELIEECAPNLRFIHNTIEYGNMTIQEARDVYKYIYDTVELGLNSSIKEVCEFYEKHYDEDYLYECWYVLNRIDVAIRNSVKYDPIDQVFIVSGVKIKYDVFMKEAGHGCTIKDIDGDEFVVNLKKIGVNKHYVNLMDGEIEEQDLFEATLTKK